MAALRPRVLTALARLRAWKFALYFFRRTIQRLIVTPLGIRVMITEHWVDWPRVSRVVERIARGLYFHHLGQRVPPDQKAWVMFENAFDPRLGAELAPQDFEAARDILARVKREPAHEINRGEFAYRFRLLGEPGSADSVWYFRFYDAVEFVTLFTPGSLPGFPPPPRAK